MQSVAPIIVSIRCPSQVIAQPWDDSRVPVFLEKIFMRSSPIDVCFEDSVLPPLAKFLDRAG